MVSGIFANIFRMRVCADAKMEDNNRALTKRYRDMFFVLMLITNSTKVEED